MLANLLTNAMANLNQLVLTAVHIRMRKQSIPILRINMPKHGTPQMRNVIHLEQPLPPSHPVAVISVEHEHAVLGLTLGFAAVCYFAAARVLEGHFVAVFAYPVEAAVFFVGEEGGWGVFTETGGYGEAAGAGAYDEDIIDIFFDLNWVVCHIAFGLHG